MLCPICQSEYNYDENIPLILSLCGHTVCMTCCEKIIKTTTDAKFKCPFDKQLETDLNNPIRKEFPYPVIQTNSFPRNYELLKALDETKEVQQALEAEQKKFAELMEKTRNLGLNLSDQDVATSTEDLENQNSSSTLAKAQEEIARLKAENDELLKQKEEMQREQVKNAEINKDFVIEIRALKKIIDEYNDNVKSLQKDLEIERNLQKALAEDNKRLQDASATLRNLYKEPVKESNPIPEKVQILDQKSLSDIDTDDLPSKKIKDTIEPSRSIYRSNVSNVRDPLLFNQRRRESENIIDQLRASRRREAPAQKEPTSLIIEPGRTRKDSLEQENLLDRTNDLGLLQTRNHSFSPTNNLTKLPSSKIVSTLRSTDKTILNSVLASEKILDQPARAPSVALRGLLK